MENLDALEQQILELPVEQRARLAEALLESLDERTPEELERLWAAEAVRRVKGFEDGKIESKSSADVHAAIQKRLS